MEIVQELDNPEVIEREIVINDIKIRIKSIFSKQTSLDNALKNIVVRKVKAEKSG